MSWSRAKLSFFLVGGLVLLTAVCLVRAIAAGSVDGGEGEAVLCFQGCGACVVFPRKKRVVGCGRLLVLY